MPVHSGETAAIGIKRSTEQLVSDGQNKKKPRPTLGVCGEHGKTPRGDKWGTVSSDSMTNIPSNSFFNLIDPE